MSTKRRGAAAVSPDVRLRGQKRRKVSEESPVSPDEAEQSPSREASEAAEEAEEEGDSAAPEDEQEPEEDFEGDTLQAAQDKIMTELTRLKDDDGEDVAYPFIGKPDRNLYRDYYEIIQHPTSLRTIQKQVRGTDSRKNPTRTTAFPTWKSFEDEVAYIWRNAREYNEDGSDISTLAGILEKHFKRRVAEAKKHVPDPIQTSETPFKDDETPSGVTGDGDAVKRQPDTTRTTSASQEADTHRISPRYRSLRRHLASPSKSSAATTPSVAEQPSAASATAQDGPSVVKSESAGQVPPPSETAGAPNGLHSVPSEPQETPAPTPAPPPAPVSPLDSVLRRPGQDASSALIRNVHISTHPSLALQRSFSLDIPPSDAFSQQSVTINLPASHNLLTIRPKVLPGNAQRHVKMIALVGVQRLHPSTNDPSGLAYDLPLPPGTTKIDLEAIAGPARGVPKTGPPGTEIDYERVTIFVNLLR